MLWAAMPLTRVWTPAVAPSPAARGPAGEDRGATIRHDDRRIAQASQVVVARACTHVAMESTSVYWKPVFNLLEGSFEVVLANAYHNQGCARPEDRREGLRVDREPPGARAHPSQLYPAATDPRLARSHATSQEPHPGSGPGHKPGAQAAGDGQHQTRERCRRRAGRAMLDALVAGETDPERLAKLAKGSLTPKVKPLAAALRGRFTSHHAFLLGQRSEERRV